MAELNSAGAEPELSYAWVPQGGPQFDAFTAKWCDELLYGGAKFGGKSDFLLGDYLSDVPTYKEHWHGILIRQSMPELEDMIRRSHEIYPQTGAVWGEQKKTWTWPNFGGASLKMRALERAADFYKYNGHSYPWIGMDELGQWADPAGYHMMKGCLRWAGYEIPNKRMRASANPCGAGHHWVKSYFIDNAPLGYVPFQDPETEMWRMFIPARVADNKLGLERDPDYIKRLRGVGTPTLVDAWLKGDWSVVVGAYFTEFDPTLHIVKPHKIPEHCLRFGAMDWGRASPAPFGWYYVSDGSDGYPVGAIIMYREWYCGAKPNVGLELTAEEYAAEVISRTGPERLAYVVADPDIFRSKEGPSIAEKLHLAGLTGLIRGDNSRIAGWTELAGRLRGQDGRPMIYYFETCRDAIRCLPSVQHDERNPEDVDTRGDDHTCDRDRYAVMSRPWVTEAPVKVEPIGGLEQITYDQLWDAEKERLSRDRSRI